MTETLRLRVEFTDLHILRNSQITDGLRRSWILLKPQHRTISDLAAYLLHVFNLHDSCPDGLLISMDEFVLPPFESTCIFKDKDIVSVRRKGVSEIAMIEDGGNCVEVEEFIERRLVNGGMKLLAGEEFEKEKGGYESDLEEDELDELEDTLPVKSAPGNGTSTHSKKRKRSEKPGSSKKKRSKLATTGACSTVQEGIQGNVQEYKKSAQKCRAKKILLKKEKITTIEGELDDSSASDTDERTNNISHSTHSANRSSQLQENGMNGVVSSEKPDESNKFPSRSARRKKARRKWLRENMKAQKEESHQTQVDNQVNQKSSNNDYRQSSDKANQPLSVNDNQKSSGEDGSETDNDEDDNVVPVVTRPGHIRFAPLRKVNADQSFQQNEIPVSLNSCLFQWNGITSKKKGQKWGMEKTSYSKKSNYEDVYQESSVMVGIEEEIPETDPLDFDKLELSTTVPKEGDQIAYRLIELSSCWTPEISSYRVGKVSRYNPQSNKIVLVQVPEYPIVFEEMTDETSEVQPDTSLYGEDGSLEIDYSSLIDVRIVKYGKLNTAKAAAGDQNAASDFRLKNGTETKAASDFRLKNDKETQAAASGFRLKNDKGSQAATSGFRLKNDKGSQAAASGFGNDKEKSASTQENGKVNTWDEISQALNAKKAELSQENGSWKIRPWRGSALGPTMALLRAQSEL
ncbi:coilin [Argentina anserina]|uniref:coilin n=1 Tax=Argentina anserina TaxID=57926 RepID=UPI0021764DBF|nr:coilin [Potentilla anserina]